MSWGHAVEASCTACAKAWLARRIRQISQLPENDCSMCLFCFLHSQGAGMHSALLGCFRSPCFKGCLFFCFFGGLGRGGGGGGVMTSMSGLLFQLVLSWLHLLHARKRGLGAGFVLFQTDTLRCCFCSSLAQQDKINDCTTFVGWMHPIA